MRQTDYAGNALGSQSVSVSEQQVRTAAPERTEQRAADRAVSEEQSGRADSRLLPLKLIESPATRGMGLEQESRRAGGLLPAAPEPLLPRGLLAISPTAVY
ncbi:hypothetical protein NDU88_006469 [Pleurodeles waltl]|uniref:Uncharacterized protein n=1 Tax=Pleurodeles waltl TaxID=8319 RepID=A0AAV7RLJ4_PLEWA|nr:hypothetical protein NDU88_006469 [Pleurodeles waltl]